MASSELDARIRRLNTSSANGTLKKELGLGDYVLTGWLGDIDKSVPRVKMATMQVSAKGLAHAKAQFARQFKNQLPKDVFDPNTGLVIIRVQSAEPPRAFPADTVPVLGVVKFWKEVEGTGFITADGKDYFVHHSEVVTGDEEVFPNLQAGMKVNFIPDMRDNRPIACNVCGAEE
jgi:cold shock CspA family protein